MCTMKIGDVPERLVLDSFLPYRLSLASNAASNLIAGVYEARFGLSIPQWRLVAVLAEQACATPQDLVALTRMDKIAVSRAANQLKGRGLVDSEPNPNDGRSHFLSLSPAGRRLYRRIAPLALALESRLIAEFSASERTQFADFLRRIESIALQIGTDA
jgi:DNA-binding MarR family transcriptional regulator